jgi:hypothetical protein
MPDLDAVRKAYPCGRSSWLPLVLFVHGVVQPFYVKSISRRFRAAHLASLIAYGVETLWEHPGDVP